jgi:hypothetical protein
MKILEEGCKFLPMLSASLVTTAWRDLKLRIEETAPDMEGSCEYIE